MKTNFKSEILNENIECCICSYKTALKNGDFKKTKQEINQSIERLLKDYEMEDIKDMIEEEKKDNEMKTDIIKNIVISNIISAISSATVTYIAQLLKTINENENIIAKTIINIAATVIITIIVIFNICKMIKDIINENNKNFLEYYKKQLENYVV